MDQTSPLKVEANRRNAVRSTGPRTPAGKRTSRWNAMKHGLLAREVVILNGDGKEDPAEFEALLTDLQEYFDPQGPMEGILVERIAVSYWRLRRVLRCEIGETGLRQDNVVVHDVFGEADSLELTKNFLEISHKELQRSSHGIQVLLEILAEVLEEMDEEGKLSTETVEKVRKHFGDGKETISYWCFALSVLGAEKTGQTPPPDDVLDTIPPEAWRQVIRSTIVDEQERLKKLKKLHEEMEALRTEARLASLSLPPREEMDRILRYETTIERQLYKALNQLERLQRQRAGEAVPPPINVEVTSDEK